MKNNIKKPTEKKKKPTNRWHTKRVFINWQEKDRNFNRKQWARSINKQLIDKKCNGQEEHREQMLNATINQKKAKLDNNEISVYISQKGKNKSI